MAMVASSGFIVLPHWVNLANASVFVEMVVSNGLLVLPHWDNLAKTSVFVALLVFSGFAGCDNRCF